MRGHIAGIRSTIAAIWSKWFPESGHRALEAPTLERYGPAFDPKTGMGGVEIWVPIES
jgi:AraC family transcriptional regulator